MPSSFRKEAGHTPLRYRTPSPPIHAYEPLSPLVNGDNLVEALGFGLRWANNNTGARNGRKRPYISQQEDGNVSQMGYHSSGSAMDAFASIALATKPNSFYDSNIPTKTQHFNEYQSPDRPSKRARSEKLPSPDWSRKTKAEDTRPATSYEQSPESRRLEAELLLNFAQQAAKYTSPSPVLPKANTSHIRSVSEVSMIAPATPPNHYASDQRYTVADAGSIADEIAEQGPPFSPISNPAMDDQPNAPETGFGHDTASESRNSVKEDSKPPDNVKVQISDCVGPKISDGSQSEESRITSEYSGPDLDVSDGNTIISQRSDDQNTARAFVPTTNAQAEELEQVDRAATALPSDDTLQMMKGAFQEQGDGQTVKGEILDNTVSEEVQAPSQEDSLESESRVIHDALGDKVDTGNASPTTSSGDAAQSTLEINASVNKSTDTSTDDTQPSSATATAVCAACNFARNSVAIEKDDNSTSWISCDACKDWFHFACAGFKNEREVRSVDKFRCRKCKPVHGATTYVRKSSRAHSAIDYAGLHQGVIKTSDESPEHHYIKPIKDGTITFLPENFARMRPELVTAEYFEKGFGMKEPIVIPACFNSQPNCHIPSNVEQCQTNGEPHPNPLEDGQIAEAWFSSNDESELVSDQGQDDLDMVIPQGLTVRQVCELYGPEEKVEVIDVKSQNGENKKWNMRRWADYYENPNNKVVRNVISLEVSQSKLGRLIRRPKIVRDLDLQDFVWPEEMLAKGEYPRVQFYCLMSVADCFTDFHIDFGGSSVFYHILKGKKTFLFIPPKEKHLKKYEDWCMSPAQNWTFLGDQTKECYRVDLSEGDTMLIPAGWIHAVWTPEDSLVIGGNFLTRMNFAMQFRVAQVEKTTGVARKFRYPNFQKLHWYTALRYLEIDPLPNNVKDLLHRGGSFHRETPAHLEFDAWGENSQAGSENYHARYYSQSELEGLPELVKYLLRTALIDIGGITDGISADTRNAVKKSIPRGHGHGEPLEVIKTFAAWVAWKRGDEPIPHWAYPESVPETVAPDKLSAAAMKKLDREAALSAPRRHSARMQSQQEATEKLATSSDQNGLLRISSGSGSAHRKTACESCRRRRRACKHKDQVAAMLMPQSSNSAPMLQKASIPLDPGATDALAISNSSALNNKHLGAGDGVKVVVPESQPSLESLNEGLAKSLTQDVLAGFPKTEERTAVDVKAGLDPVSMQGRPRHKACNDCRKSKVSIIIAVLVN